MDIVQTVDSFLEEAKSDQASLFVHDRDILLLRKIVAKNSPYKRLAARILKQAEKHGYSHMANTPAVFSFSTKGYEWARDLAAAIQLAWEEGYGIKPGYSGMYVAIKRKYPKVLRDIEKSIIRSKK